MYMLKIVLASAWETDYKPGQEAGRFSEAWAVTQERGDRSRGVAQVILGCVVKVAPSGLADGWGAGFKGKHRIKRNPCFLLDEWGWRGLELGLGHTTQERHWALGTYLRHFNFLGLRGFLREETFLKKKKKN